MDERQGDERQPYVELGIEGYEEAVEIGHGGFSVVYRARQPSFDRHVAIKVLSVNLGSTEIDRFARECEAIGALQGHPNIVTVHASGRLAGGQPYIVMELLSGSLAERIERQPLDWTAAVAIGIKLAGAIESAHRAGVLHRDVKPANVLVSRFGECKLGDFGIARVEGGSETRSGGATASWEFAPPEIVEGHRPSPVSDVYSLAATLFTLIDGEPPFGRADAEGLTPLLARILTQPLRKIGGDIPVPVERVIRQGLAKDPSQRPPSASELGRQLQATQAEAGLAVTPLPLEGVDTADGAARSTRRVQAVTLPPADDEEQDSNERSTPRVPKRRAWLAAGALGAVVIAGLAFSLRPDAEGVTSTTTTDVTTSVASTAATTDPPGSAPATTAAAAAAVRLGADLGPATTAPCRTPTLANGAAWQLGEVTMGGRTFAGSYYCNLFAGGTGSLDFVLGSSYRVLRVSIGFVDGSTATGHQVRFEIIGDGDEYLIDPQTLTFGQVEDLEIDVTDVTRLQLKITELSPGGGSGAASQPVLASPMLVPA